MDSVIFSVISTTHNDRVYDEAANDDGAAVTIDQLLANYYAEERDTSDGECATTYIH